MPDHIDNDETPLGTAITRHDADADGFEREPTDPALVDESPDVTPATFSFADFLAGSRTTRRSVILHMRGDVIGRLEEIEQEARSLEDDDPTIDALLDEFNELRETFTGSARTFYVERKSSEWIRAFHKNIGPQLGLKINKAGEVMGGDPAKVEELAILQCAAQTVIPADVTAEGLMQLAETNQGEVDLLLTCMWLVNSQTAETAKVVRPDFSLKPSTSPATPRS